MTTGDIVEVSITLLMAAVAALLLIDYRLPENNIVARKDALCVFDEEAPVILNQDFAERDRMVYVTFMGGRAQAISTVELSCGGVK